MDKPNNPFRPFKGHPTQSAPPADDALAGSPDDLAAYAAAKARDKARGAYAARSESQGAPHVAGDHLPPFEPSFAGPTGGLFAEGAEESDAERLLQAHPLDREPLFADETPQVPGELEVCQICQMKKDAEEARLRALAELDNARKRLIREKEESIRYAAEKVLADILPSLDNLDLALKHAGNDPASRNLVTGVEMTRKLMLDSLKKHGLTPVGAPGEEFNPALHEAVGMVQDPSVPEGHVSALLACGYKLHDRLLRPARVTVSKKG